MRRKVYIFVVVFFLTIFSLILAGYVMEVYQSAKSVKEDKTVK